LRRKRMMQVKIRSLNLSENKGTIKQPVESVYITETGLDGDAHAGYWHRQVSLLGVESIKKAGEQNGQQYNFGDFGENITTEGIELYKANILDRFQAGEVLMEITQIGKKCHKGCEIMNISGNCIMPAEGIFCRVLKPGKLKTGDVMHYIPKQIKISVITLSDRAYNNIYPDKSGPLAERLLEDFFKSRNRPVHIEKIIIPDDEQMLKNALREAVDHSADIIVTTGGTGIGKRDITPDVVKTMLDKEIPGIMELIRYKYGSENPNALLSRSIAGVAGNSLVYVLPGNTRAVNEYLSEISKTLEHSLRMIHGIDSH
jgi:molybdopterin adenylyltransferase